MDAGLFAAYTTAFAIDVHQAVKKNGIFSHCFEGNPVVGACGDRVPMVVYVPASMLLIAGIAYAIPRGQWRTAFLGIAVGFETSMVVGNIMLGGGI